ncbi:MAG: DUF1343 domain-containing protein [Deltaproteobacteria bacterium]|nr:DUF1343 domain-containing protein [Deltaproteobacteria bacterium]
MLVGRGDQTLGVWAFGDRADGEPMSVDTVFDLASLTKPFTALAVLSLVHEEKLELSDPIGKYIPELARPKFSQVTIGRLLDHTSGLPAEPPDLHGLGVGFPRAARFLGRARPKPPGTFAYSDVGYALLGECVRRVSGQPLDDYLFALLAPLHLEDTSFHPADLTRVAPTEFVKGTLLRGIVHDPFARKLGGVAGHAGLFSTATDLARFVRMFLRRGDPEPGRGAVPPSLGKSELDARVISQALAPIPPLGERTLAFDVSSAYSRAFSLYFPKGSVGHTGFTGTSVWLDPGTGVFFVLLTSRVYPNGRGAPEIRDLRERVAAGVASATFSFARTATLAELPAPPARTSTTPVLTGLDVLVQADMAPLSGHRVGLVANATSLDRHGRRTIDLIAKAKSVQLATIFTPEHGLSSSTDSPIPDSKDRVTGVPIYSLYGPRARPTAEILQGLSAIVFDVQDVGARFYTYLSTLTYVLEAAGAQRIPVFVLDRPNVLGGEIIEGPILDEDLLSFTAPHTLPVRTSLTIGEFARLVVRERAIPVELVVVQLKGWSRSTRFEDTGLSFVPPSPNIRTLTQALLYPGIGLLEATNLSVGRGTDLPFEQLGAPWVDAEALAAYLAKHDLPGFEFTATEFVPRASVYQGELCRGVRITVTDPGRARPVTLGLAIHQGLLSRHPEKFRGEKIQRLLGHRETVARLLAQQPLVDIVKALESEAVTFRRRASGALLYR